MQPTTLRALSTAVATAVVLVALPTSATQAQSSWERYKPGTLAAAIRDGDSTIRNAVTEKRASGIIDDRPSQHFMGDYYSIRANVTFRGESRPIDSVRRGLIAEWGLTYMRDSSIASDFHREYLFQEGEQLLWLPVQDRVASFFPKELRPGQRLSIYAMLLGGYYDKGRITWAFIVNEFRAGPPPA